MTTDWITPKEISAELRISISSATTLVRTKLPHLNVSTGRRPTYRVSRKVFEQFLAAAFPPPETTPALRPLPPGVKRFV